MLGMFSSSSSATAAAATNGLGSDHKEPIVDRFKQQFFNRPELGVNPNAGIIIPYSQGKFHGTRTIVVGGKKGLAKKKKNGAQAFAARAYNRQSGVVPPLRASIRNVHRFRFICTAGAGYGITLANLFGAMGGIVDVVNSSLICWATALQLQRVTIYESAQGVATVNSSIQWYNTTDVNSPDEYTVNSTIPYDRPSVISQKPFPKSLASFWWNTQATPTLALFNVVCSIGSIIDVTLMFDMGNAAPALPITIAAGTLGGYYYLALDGRASNKLQPVGLPFTA